MRCLAFDAALNMGWAAGDLRGQPVFGNVNLAEAGPKHGARFFQALVDVQRLVNEHKPQIIVLEKAIASGAAGSEARPQLAYGWRTIIHLVGFKAGITVDEFAINSIRKHFIGTGGLGGDAAKAKTIEQCIDHGWIVDDHNQADALAVWAFTGEKLGLRRNRHFGGLF